MREIIFRGKRKDNGEWVYGDLYHDWNRLYTKPDIKIANNMGKFPIIPETVGQYTGLKDKNGKKVFEGDIIRKTNEGRNPEIFIANIHTNFRVYEDIYYSPCDHFTKSCEYEIIGNIHDNPDLLEK